ncbi:hypothetical protein GCM10010214_39520 [Streptomyces abikoensis]|nr:hypothetical protein GCM10010214_39520 [Streptomyces abikoensis]
MIRVDVHSHQNARGSPETLCLAALPILATDMSAPPKVSGTKPLRTLRI